MIDLSLPQRALLAKSYRVCRIVVLGLAALYVATVTTKAASYTGAGFAALVFAAQTLIADANDMAAALFRQAGLADITSSGRPLRYVLLCSPIDGGKTGKMSSPEDLAYTQQNVIQQLTTHSGPIYNGVRKNIDSGKNQIIIILRPGDTNTVLTWAFYDPKDQTCLADKDNPARELGRVPASVIFAPDKPFKIEKQG